MTICIRRLALVLGLALAACMPVGCGSTQAPGVAIDARADVETVAGWTTFLVMPDEDADLNAFGRAVRRHLEREGHRVVTTAGGPWDVFVVYGYESQGWRETTTSPRYRHSYEGVSWTTGGHTSVSRYTDVKTYVGFIERAEVVRLGGDTRLAEMAWKGTRRTRVHTDAFRISDHADRFVAEILDEFVAWTRPEPPAVDPSGDPATDAQPGEDAVASGRDA